MDYHNMSRADVIREIRAGLKARSRSPWSVTGGKGTAYGWLRIQAAPRVNPQGWMTPEQCQELAQLLGKETVHPQGWSVAASTAYYREAIDRAHGRTPSVIGTPYWD